MYTYEFDSFPFSFCPSINLNNVCENWQIVTLRFVKLFKLGWMALFVVKRTTMKVKGVIVSASSPHLRHLNFKKKWYKLLHICNMYVEFHAELFLVVWNNSVKFSKMIKIILKICSLKKNWNCWIELNSELFLSIVSFHGSYINCKLSNNITLKQQSVIFYNIFSSKALSKKKKLQS